jgi:hypothetical protein
MVGNCPPYVRHDVVYVTVLHGSHDKTCRPIGSTLGGCGGGRKPPLQSSTNNVTSGESQRTSREARAFPESATGERARVWQ